MKTSLVVGLCVACVVVGIGAGMWIGAGVGLPGPVPSAREGATPPGDLATRGEDRGGSMERECPALLPCPPCRASAPCPVCPASPPPGPGPEAAAPCPACPAEAVLCAGPRAELSGVRERLDTAEAQLAAAKERLTKRGPAGRYDAPTAQGRRRLAAQRDNLLLELPSWGDSFALSDKVAERLALSPGDRAALEQAYQDFQKTLYADLRELLVELTGDPAAGETATLNALVHDILGLSPRPLCRERMLAVTAALAAGTPLPPAAADAPVCEILILSLFDAVDRLDGEIRGSLGPAAAEALWSGTSTFEFANQGTGPDDGPVP